jgi:hypothetical protein
VAVALLAIAFSTDNWLYIEVKRAQIHQVSYINMVKLYLINLRNFTQFWTYYLIYWYI